MGEWINFVQRHLHLLKDPTGVGLDSGVRDVVCVDDDVPAQLVVVSGPVRRRLAASALTRSPARF